MISKNILIKSNNTKKKSIFKNWTEKKEKKSQISNFNFHDTSKKWMLKITVGI